MHYPSHEHFLSAVGSFLGPYYLMFALMNGLAAFYLWQSKRSVTYVRLGPLQFTSALLWLVVGGVYIVLAGLAGLSIGIPSIPQSVRDFVNASTGPVVYSAGSTILFFVMYWGRRYFVNPTFAWSLLNVALLVMGMSMFDENFFAIVAKPDNVPIVALVFLLGFFTWLSAHRAVQNDERRKQGLPPLEKLDDEKILVWPDLVYTELICMIVVTAILIFWGIALEAPLEEAGSLVKTPNPSKAPWYFLGLQEMLVYYDPWMAGVVLPSLVVVGLAAIPYMDFNKAGSGYYTIDERKFAYLIFQFGFLVMWVTLIILGTFLRGPNWNFFGPYEFWDAHKVQALNNVNLSQYFWISGLGTSLPKASANSGFIIDISYILLREAPGILLVLGYFVVLPPVMAITFLRKFYVRMGFIRFMLMTNLLLFMAALPIKMVLRWTVNMKYLIAIPEYFLNF